jgi:putative ABC transport system permease protein
MERFLQDMRYAARQLWKHPVFTVTAILTLALGIGANTAIFTVVQSILLAPLPYTDADRIVALNTHWTNNGHTSHRVTGPDAADVRAQAHSFEAVSMYAGGSEGVQLRDHAVFTVVTAVEPSFPHVFGFAPVAGRAFTETDLQHEMMVSAQFARDNFGSAQAALGQTLQAEGEPGQIVGVLPRGFDFPEKTQVWVAHPFFSVSHPQERTAFNYKAVAKLRAGVSAQSAQPELDAVSHRLEAAYPDANKNKQMVVAPLQEELTGKARPMLVLLFAAVALILLIACVNVTHLELARSIDRQRELAVRTALGSSRWQLGRLVIAESLLISLCGAVLGILLAAPAVQALLAMAPAGLPRAEEVHLNGWVLAFTLALSLLTTFASSLIPARRAAKVDPAHALKQDSSRGMAGQGTTALRNGLVVAEVAATFVLAVGAGLLLRTLVTLTARNMGYQTARMLVVDADAPAHTQEDAQNVIRGFDTLFARMAALPGVERAAGVMGLPTGAYGSNGYYQVKGGLPVNPNHAPYADFSVASPGYFQTMSIPLLRGRDFSSRDAYDGQFVAVISESLAKQSLGDADPVGKQIQCGLDSDKWMTVVGVVGDVRQASPAANPGPTLYMPMAQHPFYGTQIHLVLRTSVAPLSLMNTVQSEIQQMNPQIAVKFTTMDAMVGESIATERFRSVLIAAFAGVGLLLAMLGVYGTMAYSVAQRTFEIGVRMAFGAEKDMILRMILWHAAKLACWGIAIGFTLSLAITRLIGSMLVGVHAIDPISLAVAATLLLFTAAIAALMPAWRAAQVDPMLALRAE